jgi:hypothetical protein
MLSTCCFISHWGRNYSREPSSLGQACLYSLVDERESVCGYAFKFTVEWVFCGGNAHNRKGGRPVTAKFIIVMFIALSLVRHTGDQRVFDAALSAKSCQCEHTPAHVSIRQHTAAYVSIRQHTSAYCALACAASPSSSLRNAFSMVVSTGSPLSENSPVFFYFFYLKKIKILYYKKLFKLN